MSASKGNRVTSERSASSYAVLLATVGLVAFPARAEVPCPDAPRSSISGTGVFVFEGRAGRNGAHAAKRTKGRHYRIPSLVKVEFEGKSQLVAFAEERISDCDHGDVDIVYKTSDDNGRNWSSLERICDKGTDTCGNPTAVWDWNTKRLILLFNSNPGQTSLRDTRRSLSKDEQGRAIPNPRFGERRTHVRMATPAIVGGKLALTWEASERDLTSLVRPAIEHERNSLTGELEWVGWDGVGPGNGIVLERGKHAGRVVIPALGRNIYLDPAGDWTFQSLAKPNGAAPRVLGLDGTPLTGTGETSIAELMNGSLLRADRAIRVGSKGAEQVLYRKPLSVGHESGEGWLWTDFVPHQDLNVPGHFCNACDASSATCTACGTGYRGCQSSLWRYSSGISRLMFASPVSTKRRENMAVHVSLDEGETWPHCRIIERGAVGYSSMARTGPGDGNNRIAVLYETTGAGANACSTDSGTPRTLVGRPGSIKFEAYSLEELGVP